MSDENVGGLVIQWRHNAQGCGRRDAQAAATWRSCARQLEAALSAHGQPVVDEAMVDRAINAYAEIADDCMGVVRKKAIRAALTAALGATP